MNELPKKRESALMRRSKYHYCSNRIKLQFGLDDSSDLLGTGGFQDDSTSGDLMDIKFTTTGITTSSDTSILDELIFKSRIESPTRSNIRLDLMDDSLFDCDLSTNRSLLDQLIKEDLDIIFPRGETSGQTASECEGQPLKNFPSNDEHGFKNEENKIDKEKSSEFGNETDHMLNNTNDNCSEKIFICTNVQSQEPVADKQINENDEKNYNELCIGQFADLPCHDPQFHGSDLCENDCQTVCYEQLNSVKLDDVRCNSKNLFNPFEVKIDLGLPQHNDFHATLALKAFLKINSRQPVVDGEQKHQQTENKASLSLSDYTNDEDTTGTDDYTESTYPKKLIYKTPFKSYLTMKAPWRKLSYRNHLKRFKFKSRLHHNSIESSKNETVPVNSLSDFEKRLEEVELSVKANERNNVKLNDDLKENSVKLLSLEEKILTLKSCSSFVSTEENTTSECTSIPYNDSGNTVTEPSLDINRDSKQDETNKAPCIERSEELSQATGKMKNLKGVSLKRLKKHISWQNIKPANLKLHAYYHLETTNFSKAEYGHLNFGTPPIKSLDSSLKSKKSLLKENDYKPEQTVSVVKKKPIIIKRGAKKGRRSFLYKMDSRRGSSKEKSKSSEMELKESLLKVITENKECPNSPKNLIKFPEEKIYSLTIQKNKMDSFETCTSPNKSVILPLSEFKRLSEDKFDSPKVSKSKLTIESKPQLIQDNDVLNDEKPNNDKNSEDKDLDEKTSTETNISERGEKNSKVILILEGPDIVPKNKIEIDVSVIKELKEQLLQDDCLSTGSAKVSVLKSSLSTQSLLDKKIFLTPSLSKLEGININSNENSRSDPPTDFFSNNSNNTDCLNEINNLELNQNENIYKSQILNKVCVSIDKLGSENTNNSTEGTSENTLEEHQRDSRLKIKSEINRLIDDVMERTNQVLIKNKQSDHSIQKIATPLPSVNKVHDQMVPLNISSPDVSTDNSKNKTDNHLDKQPSTTDPKILDVSNSKNVIVDGGLINDKMILSNSNLTAKNFDMPEMTEYDNVLMPPSKKLEILNDSEQNEVQNTIEKSLSKSKVALQETTVEKKSIADFLDVYNPTEISSFEKNNLPVQELKSDVLNKKTIKSPSLTRKSQFSFEGQVDSKSDNEETNNFLMLKKHLQAKLMSSNLEPIKEVSTVTLEKNWDRISQKKITLNICEENNPQLCGEEEEISEKKLHYLEIIKKIMSEIYKVSVKNTESKEKFENMENINLKDIIKLEKDSSIKVLTDENPESIEMTTMHFAHSANHYKPPFDINSKKLDVETPQNEETNEGTKLVSHSLAGKTILLPAERMFNKKNNLEDHYTNQPPRPVQIGKKREIQSEQSFNSNNELKQILPSQQPIFCPSRNILHLDQFGKDFQSKTPIVQSNSPKIHKEGKTLISPLKTQDAKLNVLENPKQFETHETNTNTSNSDNHKYLKVLTPTKFRSNKDEFSRVESTKQLERENEAVKSKHGGVNIRRELRTKILNLNPQIPKQEFVYTKPCDEAETTNSTTSSTDNPKTESIENTIHKTEKLFNRLEEIKNLTVKIQKNINNVQMPGKEFTEKLCKNSPSTSSALNFQNSNEEQSCLTKSQGYENLAEEFGIRERPPKKFTHSPPTTPGGKPLFWKDILPKKTNLQPAFNERWRLKKLKQTQSLDDARIHMDMSTQMSPNQTNRGILCSKKLCAVHPNDESDGKLKPEVLREALDKAIKKNMIQPHVTFNPDLSFKNQSALINKESEKLLDQNNFETNANEVNDRDSSKSADTSENRKSVSTLRSSNSNERSFTKLHRSPDAGRSGLILKSENESLPNPQLIGPSKSGLYLSRDRTDMDPPISTRQDLSYLTGSTWDRKSSNPLGLISNQSQRKHINGLERRVPSSIGLIGLKNPHGNQTDTTTNMFHGPQNRSTLIFENENIECGSSEFSDNIEHFHSSSSKNLIKQLENIRSNVNDKKSNLSIFSTNCNKYSNLQKNDSQKTYNVSNTKPQSANQGTTTNHPSHHELKPAKKFGMDTGESPPPPPPVDIKNKMSIESAERFLNSLPNTSKKLKQTMCPLATPKQERLCSLSPEKDNKKFIKPTSSEESMCKKVAGLFECSVNSENSSSTKESGLVEQLKGKENNNNPIQQKSALSWLSHKSQNNNEDSCKIPVKERFKYSPKSFFPCAAAKNKTSMKEKLKTMPKKEKEFLKDPDMFKEVLGHVRRMRQKYANMVEEALKYPKNFKINSSMTPFTYPVFPFYDKDRTGISISSNDLNLDTAYKKRKDIFYKFLKMMMKKVKEIEEMENRQSLNRIEPLAEIKNKDQTLLISDKPSVSRLDTGVQTVRNISIQASLSKSLEFLQKKTYTKEDLIAEFKPTEEIIKEQNKEQSVYNMNPLYKKSSILKFKNPKRAKEKSFGKISKTSRSKSRSNKSDELIAETSNIQKPDQQPNLPPEKKPILPLEKQPVLPLEKQPVLPSDKQPVSSSKQKLKTKEKSTESINVSDCKTNTSDNNNSNNEKRNSTTPNISNIYGLPPKNVSHHEHSSLLINLKDNNSHSNSATNLDKTISSDNERPKYKIANVMLDDEDIVKNKKLKEAVIILGDTHGKREAVKISITSQPLNKNTSDKKLPLLISYDEKMEKEKKEKINFLSLKSVNDIISHIEAQVKERIFDESARKNSCSFHKSSSTKKSFASHTKKRAVRAPRAKPVLSTGRKLKKRSFFGTVSESPEEAEKYLKHRRRKCKCNRTPSETYSVEEKKRSKTSLFSNENTKTSRDSRQTSKHSQMGKCTGSNMTCASCLKEFSQNDKVSSEEMYSHNGSSHDYEIVKKCKPTLVRMRKESNQSTEKSSAEGKTTPTHYNKAEVVNERMKKTKTKFADECYKGNHYVNSNRDKTSKGNESKVKKVNKSVKTNFNDIENESKDIKYKSSVEAIIPRKGALKNSTIIKPASTDSETKMYKRAISNDSKVEINEVQSTTTIKPSRVTVLSDKNACLLPKNSSLSILKHTLDEKPENIYSDYIKKAFKSDESLKTSMQIINKLLSQRGVSTDESSDVSKSTIVSEKSVKSKYKNASASTNKANKKKNFFPRVKQPRGMNISLYACSNIQDEMSKGTGVKQIAEPLNHAKINDVLINGQKVKSRKQLRKAIYTEKNRIPNIELIKKHKKKITSTSTTHQMDTNPLEKVNKNTSTDTVKEKMNVKSTIALNKNLKGRSKNTIHKEKMSVTKTKSKNKLPPAHSENVGMCLTEPNAKDTIDAVINENSFTNINLTELIDKLTVLERAEKMLKEKTSGSKRYWKY
ncbi:uncharacterized protein LOC106667767 isoform X2 [Cimex lectularius]|uniref:Uncharacterized protein n=1 Tax=Cimex lectularius TaxID=79782 RepID=A0A8I6TF64_CIMLE|nr:uncharacterized protein LOC106667767 isoform X2 [Cimex lectularius]